MSVSKEEKVFEYGFFGEVTKNELEILKVAVFASHGVFNADYKQNPQSDTDSGVSSGSKDEKLE